MLTMSQLPILISDNNIWYHEDERQLPLDNNIAYHTLTITISLPTKSKIMNKVLVLCALFAAFGGNQQLFAAANVAPDNAVDGSQRRLSKGGKGGKPNEPGRGGIKQLDHASGKCISL